MHLLNFTHRIQTPPKSAGGGEKERKRKRRPGQGRNRMERRDALSSCCCGGEEWLRIRDTVRPQIFAVLLFPGETCLVLAIVISSSGAMALFVSASPRHAWIII